MREVLDLCIELDRSAKSAYETMASHCTDGEIAEVFRQLALEEGTHIEWWTELRDAWEDGLVPDIADEAALRQRLVEIRDAVDTPDIKDCEHWSSDDMLDLAVRFEFFMLDPLFGELLTLVQPGSGHASDAYDRHVARLIELVEERYTRPGLGSLLAGVLRRAYRDQQRLASLAVHDQLTGAFNRRGALAHLDQWVSWSNRYHRPLGLMLIDLDHFKQINDRFGHQRGDDALAAVARVLQREVRASDVVGRFGGDEFLLIVPEGGRADLFALMTRLAAALKHESIATTEGDLHLAASVGGAWTDGATAATAQAMIALADRSLYAAKEAGRSRAGEVLEPGLEPELV